MRELSIREMRSMLGRLEELVEKEGEVLVTRHGRPVARVVPVNRRRELPSRRELRRSMPPMKVPSEVLLRQERDER